MSCSFGLVSILIVLVLTFICYTSMVYRIPLGILVVHDRNTRLGILDPVMLGVSIAVDLIIRLNSFVTLVIRNTLWSIVKFPQHG